jgi:hypothetical protein
MKLKKLLKTVWNCLWPVFSSSSPGFAVIQNCSTGSGSSFAQKGSKTGTVLNLQTLGGRGNSNFKD